MKFAKAFGNACVFGVVFYGIAAAITLDPAWIADLSGWSRSDGILAAWVFFTACAYRADK